MYKNLVAAAAISACLSGAALADTLNFANTPSGSASYTNAGSVTAVSNPGSTGPATVGYFATFSQCASCTTLFSFTSASTNFEFMSITTGGHTDIIDLSSVVFQYSNNNTDLVILGSGTSQIDGGALQAIALNFTIQGGANTNDSYSGVISTTPLPGTWALLLTALLGFGMFAYRGSKKQAQTLNFA